MAGAFLWGDLNSLGFFVLDQEVFISFIVIYDYFILLSCSIWFLCLVLANLILFTFAHARYEAYWWLGACNGIEITWIFQN